jgi:ATP-dependent HslUV protease ATP-binding subunit HslU
MEEISFRAPEMEEKNITIDAKYVQARVKDLMESTDLKKYIL